MKLKTPFSRATLVALLAASAGAGALLALTGRLEATRPVAGDPPPVLAPSSPSDRADLERPSRL
jgi:hypothetical protein